MDRRQLLATLSPASIAELSPYTPAEVANAAAVWDALEPRAFGQLERNLPLAEQDSRVTPGQANRLAQDEATIIRGIESSGLIPSIISVDVGQVQDLVAEAFIEKAESSPDWFSQEQELEDCTGGTKVNPQLIHRTIEQMFAVAGTAGVSSERYVLIQGDINALETSLGINPNSTPGDVETATNYAAIYYEGQVSPFIH
jgi:hypothetical protein